MDKVNILGVNVDVIDEPEFLAGIDRLAAAQRPALINNVNAHACNIAYTDPEFRDILNRSEIVFCDGFGTKVGAWLLGRTLGQRLSVPDWLDALFELCVRRQYGVYFLGDTNEVVLLFAQRVKEKYPALRVMGQHDGFFVPGSEEDVRVTHEIERLGPDIILVGMGMPLQEKWAWRASRGMKKGVFMATGASYRWYTGYERRAPLWVTQHGMEWLARLIVAPRKHFRRYVIGLPLFFARVLCQRGKMCLSKGACRVHSPHPVLKRIKAGLRGMLWALPGGKALLRWRATFLAHRCFARRFPGMGGAKEVFRHHYETNEWGDAESASGPGSTLQYTENIRKVIPQMVEELGVRTILDAPCGDYNWFGAIKWNVPISYVGGDIVEPLIERNRARYGTERTTFITLDIVNDALPKADLWLCRDCLFHLSERDVFGALNNFIRSDIAYILTSVHSDCDLNSDIPTGAFRLLNLQLPPFNLGKPIRMMDDWIEGHPVRHLALWKRETVKDALISNAAFQRAVKYCR